MTYPISTEPEGPITDDNGDELEHGQPDPTPEDPLRTALQDLFDDYLATNGPDGYPQPMPESWRVVRDWLAAPPVEVGSSLEAVPPFNEGEPAPVTDEAVSSVAVSVQDPAAGAGVPLAGVGLAGPALPTGGVSTGHRGTSYLSVSGRYTAPALDEERLARALLAWGGALHEAGVVTLDEGGLVAANAIAREYAALATPTRAALRSSAPALDVERLARALPAVSHRLWSRSEAGDHQQVWFDEDVLRHFHEWAEYTAEAIAREYAALRSPQPPEAQ